MYNICWGKVFIGCVPGRKKQSGSEYWGFHQLIFVSPLKNESTSTRDVVATL